MKKIISVWVAINEDGDAAASFNSAAEAREHLDEEVGGTFLRVVELPMEVDLPGLVVVPLIKVPAEPAGISVEAVLAE